MWGGKWLLVARLKISAASPNKHASLSARTHLWNLAHSTCRGASPLGGFLCKICYLLYLLRVMSHSTVSPRHQNCKTTWNVDFDSVSSESLNFLHVFTLLLPLLPQLHFLAVSFVILEIYFGCTFWADIGSWYRFSIPYLICLEAESVVDFGLFKILGIGCLPCRLYQYNALAYPVGKDPKSKLEIHIQYCSSSISTCFILLLCSVFFILCINWIISCTLKCQEVISHICWGSVWQLTPKCCQ